MRVTRTVAMVVRALRGKGWVEAPALSRLLDIPRYNLQHPLAALVEEGLVERMETRPVLYRLRDTKATQDQIRDILAGLKAQETALT